MKNIIIIILSAFSLAALLEALGKIDLYQSVIEIRCQEVPGPCNNEARKVDPADKRGGLEVDSVLVEKYSGTLEDYLKNSPDKVKFRNRFFLSKVAIDSMFSTHQTVTGLNILPVIDGTDSLNIVLMPVIDDHVLIETPYKAYDYFLTQTFCPSDCDQVRDPSLTSHE